MDIQKIQQYKSAFDLIAKSIKDDEGNTIEVWYARELQQVLGYARWENFVVAIGRALESCKTLGINVDDHFREVTKMIALAKGAQREVQDFMLTLLKKEGSIDSENKFSDEQKAIALDDVQTRIAQQNKTDKQASADVLFKQSVLTPTQYNRLKRQFAGKPQFRFVNAVDFWKLFD